MTVKVTYGSVRRFPYYFEHGNRISMFSGAKIKNCCKPALYLLGFLVISFFLFHPAIFFTFVLADKLLPVIKVMPQQIRPDVITNGKNHIFRGVIIYQRHHCKDIAYICLLYTSDAADEL